MLTNTHFVPENASGFRLSNYATGIFNGLKINKNSLVAHLSRSTQGYVLPLLLAIHRPGSATSGLLTLAKTQTARVSFGRMLEIIEIDKTFQAVVFGETTASGIITDPIN